MSAGIIRDFGAGKESSFILMDKQMSCWFSVLVSLVLVSFSVLLWRRKTKSQKPNEALFAFSGQFRYDVCLSFRGEDIRRTFVGHLYTSLDAAGVSVFLDSHSIERGNEISSTILEAIHNSSILIPIFSKNFADSHWCLDEVAHMCKAKGIIMPLFYDVEPTEVRNPWRGAYAKAFEGKKQRYTGDRISEWESALHKVCSFYGWSRDVISGSDAELVKVVVKEVSEKLDQNATPVTVEEAPPQAIEEDTPDTMLDSNILCLNGAIVEGDYSKMPPDVKSLRWENCPYMKNLVVLDLSFSKDIEALWPDPSNNVEGPESLKVLKLNYCTNLQVLPDLANLTSLVQLELCGCKELKELPESIGLLTELKYLDLSNCCNLKNLPESFRWLSCLEKLSLYGCHKLRSLPQQFGDLNRLQHLDLHGCSRLQTLPESACELKSLCRLDMSGCERISLGEETGDLVRMKRLVLSNCAAIWKLPESIGKLKWLQHLNLNHCHSLFRLPEELGNLICLEELLLNGCCNLCELPQSIGKLSCLQTLEMEDTYSLSVLPPSFSKLASLKNLKASGCPLPQLVGELSSLQNMHLKSYKMPFLPPTFGTRLHLRKLYFHHCTKFLELPLLPKDLIEVHIQDCFGLKKISSMSHMKSLEVPRIHNSRELVGLPDIGSLQSLQELSISECRNVKRIQGMEGLKSLRRVYVTGCRLAGSGSSLLKPRQLIKESGCLELLSFSANGVPECLEKKMETNGDYLLYATLDSNKKCLGIIMCIMVRFKSGISSVDVELSSLRDGEEIFNARLVNHSKTVEGDQIFVHILHKNHPMVMMVQNGDVVRAKADRDKGRMIRSGGMQFFSEGEDGRRENLLLESLGRDLTMLMESYRENLAFEDEE